MFASILFAILFTNVLGFGPHCALVDRSCSSQLTSSNVTSDNDCQIIYYNAEQCKLQEFLTEKSTTNFGYVKLEPYVDEGIPRTIFNVTFHDIQWTDLRMRFQARNRNECLCRDFHLTNSMQVSPQDILYFDCPWTDVGYEGEVVDFEYQYGVANNYATRNYTFYVPKQEFINPTKFSNLRLFVYVDTSDLYNLIAKIQLAPVMFNITNYNIRVLRTRNNETQQLLNKSLSATEAKYDEISFEFPTNGEYGEYTFHVSPICENYNTCYVTITPPVLILKTNKTLAIAMVGAVCLMIPIIFIIVRIWRQYCPSEEFKEPKILLVTIPCNNAHVHIGSILASLLRESYNLNVMIDTSGIAQTPMRDPFTWFTNAFYDATDIVFLLSRNDLSANQLVYKKMDNLALNLMRHELSKNLSTKKYCAISFKYSSPAPKELLNLQSFKFMEEFEKFLSYLQNYSYCPKTDEILDITQNELYNELLHTINMVEFDNQNIAGDPVNINDNIQLAYANHGNVVMENEIREPANRNAQVGILIDANELVYDSSDSATESDDGANDYDDDDDDVEENNVRNDLIDL